MTESVAAPAEDWSHEDEFLGHPKGLYVCFTTELWERFSFYGMKFLLLLYLTKYHLFTDEMGFDVLGSYAGLVYALPVIGGLIADRYLGMRKSVLFGGIMLSLGHLLMAVEGHHAINYPAGFTLTESLTLASGEVLAAGTVLSEAITFRDTAALSVFYFALALIVMGVGYLKPNISTIVGKLYAQDDPRRDSGFTIFYMGINIGREWSIYLLSLPVLGVLWLLVQHEPVVLAMQNIFLITAIVGIVLFSMVYRKTEGGNGIAYVFALLAILVGIYAVLVNLDHLPVNLPTNAEITEYSVYGAIALIVGFVIYGFLTHSSPEFSRTVVLMFLILTTVVFWALFEQSAGSMTLFADRVVDREAGGFTFTAAQFGSLNAGFIMLLALPFASLWIWLAKRNLEPTTPVKFGLGIVQAGLGFGALVLGAQFPDAAGKISMIWLILAYLLHTTGELCLSPVGLSAVTKLSIGRVVGVSMGTWFLATVATDGGEVVNSAGALATYTQLFEFLMYVGLGVGIFVLLVSPLLRRGMHGVH